MIRRFLTVAAIVSAVMMSPLASFTFVGSTSAAGAAVVQRAGSIPDDAGHSIGSPDAGPRPQQSGDRGGSAQLTLLALLVVAVSFVMWKIFHNARGGRST